MGAARSKAKLGRRRLEVTAQQIVDNLSIHGTQKATSDHLGISLSTLKRRLDEGGWEPYTIPEKSRSGRGAAEDERRMIEYLEEQHTKPKLFRRSDSDDAF
jgi:DNA invertase Pin-like site-specific DNA recombinase